MRRADREITDRNEILAIVNRCEVCNVAFADGDMPYVVPMNFGILEREGALTLCFHCASEGKKLDVLRKNSNVAFAMSTKHVLEWEESGKCTMRYESACGNGHMRIAGEEEKRAALESIMNHYRPGDATAMPLNVPKELFARTTILLLEVEELTGKRSTPKA